jgi:hypothetical protein
VKRPGFLPIPDLRGDENVPVTAGATAFAADIFYL